MEYADWYDEIISLVLKEVAFFCEDDDIEKPPDIVDKETLVDVLGVDIERCEKCMATWEMQRYRFERG